MKSKIKKVKKIITNILITKLINYFLQQPNINSETFEINDSIILLIYLM